MSARLAVLLAPLVASCATTLPVAPLADAMPGQRAWTAACADGDGWDKPGPPFRIYGQTYYVGTCGITLLNELDPGASVTRHHNRRGGRVGDVGSGGLGSLLVSVPLVTKRLVGDVVLFPPALYAADESVNLAIVAEHCGRDDGL